MNRISLVSEKMTLKGDFGRSDINFLVWDEGRHKFETHPSADKHCIAAFCRQGNQMAVIRMHGSFSTSVKDAHFSWLKNGDGVHVGLEQYRLNFSVEKKWKKPVLFLGLLAAIAFAMFMAFGGRGASGAKPVNKPATATESVNEKDIQREYRLAKLIFGAKEYLKNGDAAQAKLNLEQALNLEPSSAEAKRLYESLLNDAHGSPDAASPVNENELNERADILLKRAREIFDGGDDKGAYELYRESLKLVVPNMAKPAWLTQAEDGLSRSKAALEGRLSSGLDKAERALGTNEAGELKQAAVTARSALSECPEFGRAKKLLDDVYGRLDELGMEHIMRAETLRRFSGCKEAAGEYRLAMSVSAFSEVPAYQKAELALSQCK